MTTVLFLQAQTFELAPNGAAFIKGQNFIKAMQPILWDKSWTNTTVDTKIPADPSLSSVNVSLPVPKTRNTVDFTTVKSTNAEGQSILSYTAKTQTSAICHFEGIRGEAHSLRVEIEKTKGSCNG